ncbi:MAG: hypothetical protein M0010_15280 [Actinomycetota bacterium]|nr:hypothetical protein [Actinomycetota bacterium]
MNVLLQIAIGVTSTVISAALIFICHAVYRVLRRLEAAERRLAELERRDRGTRHRLRILETR